MNFFMIKSFLVVSFSVLIMQKYYFFFISLVSHLFISFFFDFLNVRSIVPPLPCFGFNYFVKNT